MHSQPHMHSVDICHNTCIVSSTHRWCGRQLRNRRDRIPVVSWPLHRSATPFDWCAAVSENVSTIPRQVQKDSRSRDLNSPPLSICSLCFRITCTRTRSSTYASNEAAWAFLRVGMTCRKRVNASTPTRMYSAPPIPNGWMGPATSRKQANDY